MRISDWSSDVCSSDLRQRAERSPELVDDGVARREPGRVCRLDRRLRKRCLPHREPCGGGRQRRQRPVAARHGRAGQPQLVSEPDRSEEHTSELQSLMRISYAVFCLNKKKQPTTTKTT